VVGEGGRVVIGDVLDDDGAQIVNELGEERARFVHLDVTDGAQWRDAVATAESTFGPVSVLVNNAGIVRWGTVADLDPAVWQEVLGVNLTGVFLGMGRRSRRCDAPAVARSSTSPPPPVWWDTLSSPPTWPASGACGA
jgi:NAD(P)-dependent dehydrogenase (short-subunit alcohol dehydrogenase family)